MRGWGVIVVGLVLAVAGCEAKPAAPAEAPAQPPAVRSAECRRASGPIKLDGVLNDAAWEKAEVLRDFAVYWQDRKPKTATTARLLWDDEYLYFCADMEDADLYAIVKERNGMTWNDDVFELFFKPSEDKLAYYEFQVNALGTELEMFLPSRGAGGYGRVSPRSATSAWSRPYTWTARSTTGRTWTRAGRSRAASRGPRFKATGGRPKPGDKWRFALCRYDYSVTLDHPELSSTAPLTQSEFHRYEDYGELTFVGK